MLNSRTKTVIEIDFFELAKFVRECYQLDGRWSCSELNNGAYSLFDINPSSECWNQTDYFADYDIQNALEIINNGEGEYYGDIGSVLARLCYDKFIPPGHYLVHIYW